jgi:hypothetical protein
MGVIIAGEVFIGVADNAAADGALGDAGLDCLEQRHRAEKRYIVAVLAAGEIFWKTSRRAVVRSRCMSAIFESLMYLCVRENDFTRRLFNVAATQAIHRLSIIVGNFLYISVAAFTADTCMWASTEERFVHIKQAIVALLVHAGKASEAVTHETVFCVHSVQRVREHNYQCQCKKARRRAQTCDTRIPSYATTDNRRLLRWTPHFS